MERAGTQRVDSASRSIAAPVARVWQAWFDAGELARWLPPEGMRGEVLAFDPRPGGEFRMRLTYDDPAAGMGKSTADSDLVEGRFAVIEPHRRFVLAVTFRSDDPAFAGVMRMTWAFAATAAGTAVSVTCEDVPPGIGADDHAAGLEQSLEALARQVE